ncbi:tetratricopeptide repeat protein [Neolewinella agarilytica]|nr:CDC27 family protein [Neolewinella agarilytica]
MQKLWSRQVPQLLGTYLAVGFGVLQFVEFMTSRYDFSGVWVDRYLLLWLGLIPAVALLIYYRGVPPSSNSRLGGWKRWLTGLNVGLVVLSACLIAGADAAPVTETVAVIDDAGNSSERVIPASSSVQRIAIFDFSNRLDDSDQDWWGTAYALLLTDDLRQRPEIITTSTISLNTYYDRFSAEQFSDINLATQRRIAERASTDYFVRVDFKVGAEGHEADGALYRTRDGKPVQTLQGASADIYGVVDQLNAQILNYLPLVDELNDLSTDLPVAALLTDKVEALEDYIKGTIAFRKNAGELDAPVSYFRKSLRSDPNCAVCAYALGDKLYGQGKKDSSILLLRLAVRLADVLPEREQYGYKSILFNVQGDYTNLYRLMESFRKVYPYEYYPYQALEYHYEVTYGLDSAIYLMQTAAELSNREQALIRLYRLHRYEASLIKVVPKNVLVSRNYPAKSIYTLKTDDYEKVYELVDELGDYDPELEELYRCYLPIQMIAEGIREEEELKKLEECEDKFTQMGPLMAQLGEMVKAVLTDKHDEAAAIVDEILLNKQSPDQALLFARAYRWTGRYDSAITVLEKELKSQVNHPEILLEYATTLHLQGKSVEAQQALSRALMVWENADENFRSKRIALELAEQIGLEVS